MNEHPQISTKASNIWSLTKSDCNVLDLFCGAGGMSLGFEIERYNVLAAVDYDKAAIQTYRYNHPDMNEENIILGDLTKKDTKQSIEKVLHNKICDIIIGGPPCQGFSKANRQRVIDDPRNQLYKEFVSIVAKVQPKVVVMENVTGIQKKSEEILDDFKKIGFLGKVFLLRAEEFKIPQRRARVFFVLCNEKEYSNIEKQLQNFENHLHQSKATSTFVLKDALSGLRIIKANPKKNDTSVENAESGYAVDNLEGSSQLFYGNNNEKFLDFINGSTKKPDVIYNHKARFNNTRDIKIFSRLPQGANSLHESIADIMPYYSRNDIFKDKYFKLEEDKISKTITAHMSFDCNMYIHPTQARGLTPREAARIQTFPDAYEFKGSFTKWYKQIGNAVPPVLAKMIAQALKATILSQKFVEKQKRGSINKQSLASFKIFDLFGGVGGFHKGAELAFGTDLVECVGYCERDKWARATYLANWPNISDDKVFTDVCDITVGKSLDEIKEIVHPHDILFAGFPCQPFSLMGKQKGFEDDRGVLFFDIVKILQAMSPPLFVLENVNRLKTLENGKYFDEICRVLTEDVDYTIKAFFLNSSDYGVPQTRRRIFFVGVKNPSILQRAKLAKFAPNPPKILPQNNKYLTTWHLLQKKKKLYQKPRGSYFLSEKIKETILATGSGGWHANPEINLLTARPLTKTMHKMHRASQDNYFSESFINGSFDETTGRVILAEQGDDEIRRITPTEAFRLQGFEDDFVQNARAKGVSDTQLFMQSGNAVSATTVASLLQYVLPQRECSIDIHALSIRQMDILNFESFDLNSILSSVDSTSITLYYIYDALQQAEIREYTCKNSKFISRTPTLIQNYSLDFQAFIKENPRLFIYWIDLSSFQTKTGCDFILFLQKVAINEQKIQDWLKQNSTEIF